MVIFGIILLVLGLASLFTGAIIEANENHKGWCVFLGWCAGIFVMLSIAVLSEIDNIAPMDVYQGKTTLEYTIRDGEIVDSVVVWKTKEE